MKVRLKYGFNTETLSIEEALKYTIDLTDGGSLEAAQQRIENLTTMLTQLVDFMVDRNLLHSQDILALMPGFEEAL